MIMFLLRKILDLEMPCTGPIILKWLAKPKHYGDPRHNAVILIQFSNMCPFKFKRNAFSCVHCSFTTPDFDPLIKHMGRNHTEDRENIKEVLLKSPLSTVFKADVTNLKCDLCQESMKDIPTLYEHLDKAHDKPLITELKQGVVPYLLTEGFKCADCGSTFDRFMKLNNHVNGHYPHFNCSKCEQSFSSTSRLKNHSLVHVKRSYKCSKCDEVFPTQHLQAKHLKSTHDVYPNKCPYCSKSFKTYAVRLKHMNEVHNKKINYPCTLCSHVFSSAGGRSNHNRRVHMKLKNVSCSLCDSKFYSSSTLKKHIATHNKVNKHQCKVCKQAFVTLYSFKDHMRSHKSDKTKLNNETNQFKE